jgi:tetratricopeptide (TPR) repeat protein
LDLLQGQATQAHHHHEPEGDMTSWRIVGFGSLVLMGLLVGGLGGCGNGERAEAPPEPESQVEQLEAPVLPEGAQAISFLGEPLYPPELSEEARASRTRELEAALAELEKDPEDADALIWVGRRYAYLGEYRQAIQIFSLGMDLHPEDARFHRHRGHRFITVRELDNAIADFRRAADLVEGLPDEVEPDGQPNPLGIPTSTLHFNIWYHLGLAHYLKGELEAAAQAYRRCMEVSEHPDSKVATAHWWYMTLRRSDRTQEAEELMASLDLEALSPDVIESGAYLDMLRLYASSPEESEEVVLKLDPGTLEGATFGYGVGNFHLYSGRTDQAREIFERIVGARDQWASFGYIAAEADLARMGAR